MAISEITTGEPMVGTENDDFILADQATTGTDNNTVNANGGDDVVFGDIGSSLILESTTHNNYGSAFDLEATPSAWTTAENSAFGDSTIPHLTAIVEGTLDESEAFRVTIGAGQKIIVDVDFVSDNAFNVPGSLRVALYNASGAYIFADTWSPVTEGGLGSFSESPYLVCENLPAGDYYIEVTPAGENFFTSNLNCSFVMNVSVTGHAVAANPVQGADTINGGDGNDSLFGQGGNDAINGDDGNDLIDGGSGVDTVNGGAGNDTLHGGLGSDTLTGGLGDDLFYVDSAGDVVVELAGEGADDQVRASVSYTLGAGVQVERLTTSDSEGWTAINLSGNELANMVVGNYGDNVLDGKAGADTMVGSLGNDWYHVDNAGDVVVEGGNPYAEGQHDRIFASASYTLGVGILVEHLDTDNAAGTTAINLTGNEQDNTVTGNAGNNTLSGGAGNDILTGGAGNDTLVGGLGDDLIYVDGAYDVVSEAAGGGNDSVLASVSYSLASGAEIENLATVDADATTAINLTGSQFANSITGNDGANTLAGGGGDDVLTGYLGNDILVGGLGSDTMHGNFGDDIFYVDSSGDIVIETLGLGTDRVIATASYTLGAEAYVELLTTGSNAGTDAINLTGNGLDQTIYGNAGINSLNGGGGNDVLVALGGNDVLNGGTGNDTMNGGVGNDTYHVDAAGDVLQDVAGGGTDIAYASVSYALAVSAEVETLSTSSLVGTATISLTGNAFGQAIYGNAGVNVLDGRGGADTLVGLGGDDWYYVDNAGDVVSETAAGGAADRIFASVTYTMGAGVHVERLLTTNNNATTAINLAGNELVNVIYGNAGANTLDGRAGNDTLVGLAGNDTLVGGLGNDAMTGGTGDDLYYVDSAGDTVFEVAGEGADRVLSSVNYTLGASAQIEILTTSNNAGTAAINLTGSAIANTIYGNAGANILDGRGGADTLVGFGGDDWYYVDNAADVVSEGAGGGTTDRVFASVSFTLGASTQVEVLSTSSNAGTGAIDLTGNALANAIYGNAGNNVLDGKGGADVLIGLAGQDSFAFTTALGSGNIDTISGFAVADDTIRLENAVFTGLAAGALAAGAFNTGAAATQADDRVIYNSATGALLFDADGVGGAAAVQFAALAGGLALTSADFVVI